MTVDIARFGASEEAFATRFGRDDLPGLLRKRLEVPAGSVALVRPSEGEASVLEGGGSSGDVASGVLVKERARLEFAVAAGRSKDDLPFQVSGQLVLKARTTTVDLEQLEGSLLKGKTQVSLADVVAYVSPSLEAAGRYFVSSREAQALGTEDLRGDFVEQARKELESSLFSAGLECVEVTQVAFASEDFEKRREAAAKASDEAEALSRERELVELRKQITQEALLADIEARDEADRTRKEKRLERYEQIRERMGDDDVKALVLMLDDDRQRARLIRELIDKDLTEEQKASLQLSEMEERVEGRLLELQQRFAQLTGATLERQEGDPITKRILCVVGKRVLAFDPKTNLHPEVPKEVYDTEEGGLGYLRSVRAEPIDGVEEVLIGAQRGVYRLRGEERIEYPYATEPEGKGGANAVAYFDGRIFATHSEMGLTEWPLAGGPSRRICEDTTQGASATRGATVLDGHLYFSAGNEVFRLDLATGSEVPTRFKGCEDSVTSFVVLPDALVAGTRSGKLYRWSLDDPNSPTALEVVKANPIYMLRYTQIAGVGFLIIGSKDFTVTAMAPGKDIFREYHAREEVRWVDGAADSICGVSRSGYKVFCWDAHHQSAPKLTIRVSDKVQDLFVVRTLGREE